MIINGLFFILFSFRMVSKSWVPKLILTSPCNVKVKDLDLWQDMCHIARRHKAVQHWSPVCEACLSRTKSVDFRHVVMEPGKQPRYKIKTEELDFEYVMCLPISNRLNGRRPRRASIPGIYHIS